MNAIDILRADHDRLRGLLPKLADTSLSTEERERLLELAEREIKIHSLLEEEIFYPAFKDASRAADDRDMYFEALEEHHVVDMLLPELRPLDVSSDGFRAKAKVLRELLEHHAAEEEEDMFPKAEELLGATKLAELAQRMTDRKNELEQQWDSIVGNLLRRAQSVAEKFAPTKMKDVRVDMNREEERR